MKKTLVVLVCAVGAYCCGIGNALAWSNPLDPNAPTQEDATIVRTPTADCPTGETSQPADYEVWVYEHADFQGRCKKLLLGFYPSKDNFGLDNDSMSSIKVGAKVRARLFEHVEYGGIYMEAPTSKNLGGYGWNDFASSLRVEFKNRNFNCSDVKDGEMALFVDANYLGDCVVLPVKSWTGLARTYKNPAAMGIRNDGISSLIYRSNFNRTGFFWDVNLNSNSSACYTPYTYQYLPSLPSSYGIIVGPNDQISSIGPTANQYVCGRF
jgi:hypothetical protein